MTDASSSNMSTDDASTTYWGSLHSEIPPVDLSKAIRKANSTFIQRSRAGALENAKPTPPPREEEPQNGEEIVTIMLAYEAGSQSVVKSSEDNGESFFLGPDQSLPGEKTPTPTAAKTWHRRIGDELPTFSERNASTRPRRCLLQHLCFSTSEVEGQPSWFVVQNLLLPISNPRSELLPRSKLSCSSSRNRVADLWDHFFVTCRILIQQRLTLPMKIDSNFSRTLRTKWDNKKINGNRCKQTFIGTLCPRLRLLMHWLSPRPTFRRESSRRSSRVPSRVVS